MYVNHEPLTAFCFKTSPKSLVEVFVTLKTGSSPFNRGDHNLLVGRQVILPFYSPPTQFR